MGRWSTGAQTTESAKVIDLSYLVKQKMLQKGLVKSGGLSWSRNGAASGNIGIECRYLGDGNDYIRLYYTHTNDGIETKLDYKIRLIERDSNLGKGKVVYMECPHSGRLCRKVYMVYSGLYFKCRQAYQHRVYYPIQTSSKLWRANSRFFELEAYFDKENKRRRSYKYNGKLTKRALKNQRLQILNTKMDHERDQAFLYSCRRIVGNIF